MEKPSTKFSHCFESFFVYVKKSVRFPECIFLNLQNKSFELIFTLEFEKKKIIILDRWRSVEVSELGKKDKSVGGFATFRLESPGEQNCGQK